MLRFKFMIPLLVICMVWGSFLIGQEKKTDKEPILVSKRLPTYYNRLNLSQKQKNDIYKIRGKYEAEIQELYQKITELREQEKADCEKILTADQLARYRQILLGADRSKNARVQDEDVRNEKNESTGGDKKKGTVAKDKKKGTESKDKSAPGELNKPVEIKK